MGGRPAVSVIVVDYLAGDYLARCLAALPAALAGLASEVILVRNAPASLPTTQDRLQIISNPDNVGFARACNQGAARASGTYLFFLNPDTMAEPGSISELVRFAEAHPGAGVIGPLVMEYDGTVQGSARRFPSFATALFGRTTLLSRVLPENSYTRAEIRTCPPAAEGPATQVDWVSGAAQLIHRELFNQLHGFDEEFFLYWEDADLCLRATLAGRPSWYHSGARIRHAQGVSSSRRLALSTFAFHQSVYYYYRKNINPKAGLLRRTALASALTARGLFKYVAGSLGGLIASGKRLAL